MEVGVVVSIWTNENAQTDMGSAAAKKPSGKTAAQHYDLFNTDFKHPCDQIRTSAEVRFLANNPDTPSNENKGARHLARILVMAARQLNRSSEFFGRDCLFTLHVIDPIRFECQQPLLSTIIHDLIHNAITANSSKIELLATEYQSNLFVQIADNGTGTPRLSPLPSAHMTTASKKFPNEGFRPSLEKTGLLIEAALGSIRIVSSSAQLGTRLGFSLPILTSQESKDD